MINIKSSKQQSSIRLHATVNKVSGKKRKHGPFRALNVILLIIRIISDFFSSSNFLKKSIESHTANFMPHQIERKFRDARHFGNSRFMYGFLSFRLHQILCSIKFCVASNSMLHQIYVADQYSPLGTGDYTRKLG